MDAGLIIGIVSLFGITATNVARWLGFFARINRDARFFSLKRDESIDLVLVTSDYEEGDNYRRHVTSYDTLRAATHFAERIGGLRLDKDTNLRVSERLDDPPTRDLVVLGGSDAPKNRVAKVFLDEFNEAHPELEISRPREEGSRRLVVGSEEWDWNGWSDGKDDVNTDVAVIVVWRNPFVSESRRGIYCAGFTAAGTAAATEHLLSDLCREGRRRSLGWKRINPFARPNFVSVVEFAFAGEQALPRGEALFHSLDAPRGNPPHRRVEVGTVAANGEGKAPGRREHAVSTRHA
ncbi:MAG TPA: hypothetical protein VN758_07750 [Solirubrobacterales bacterium]|nr:hypothetical protein [Solirubrobacterales bacterium]